MTQVILNLVFVPQAIGVCVISHGEVTLLDSKFFNPRPERVVPSALRYIDQLLQLVKPTQVNLDTRSIYQTLELILLAEIERRLLMRRLPVLRLDRHDLITAFGVTRFSDRRQLQELVRILWPDLERPYPDGAAQTTVLSPGDTDRDTKVRQLEEPRLHVDGSGETTT